MGFDHVDRQFRPKPAEPEIPYCSECEGGGWVLSAYQARHPPNLERCPKCWNPENIPCP